MVMNISEILLIMLFVEGLAKQIHGWVRTYKPTSLHDSLSISWDMVSIVPKNWAFIPFISTSP